MIGRTSVMDNNKFLQACLDDEPKHLKHMLLQVDDLHSLDKQTLIEIVQTFINSDAIEYKVLKKRGSPYKLMAPDLYLKFACIIKAKITGKSWKNTWEYYETKQVSTIPKFAPLSKTERAKTERETLSDNQKNKLDLEKLYDASLINLKNAYIQGDADAKRAVNTFELKPFLDEYKDLKKLNDAGFINLKNSYLRDDTDAIKAVNAFDLKPFIPNKY